MQGAIQALIALGIFSAVVALIMIRGYAMSTGCHCTLRNCTIPVPQQLDCAWRFARYRPSEFEASWFDRIEVNQKDVCGAFRGFYGKYFATYMETTRFLDPVNYGKKSCGASSSSRSIPRDGFDAKTFSVLEYEWFCSKTSQFYPRQPIQIFIEPLAGILRHPSVCLPRSDIVNKNYMLLDGWESQASKRSFYFDVGASTWTTGLGGASQQWIVAAYKGLCVNFDQIYAWEATSIPDSTVMDQIPVEFIGKYHWYNVPASAEPGNKLNPLAVILAETRPEDFVVLKLDVDNWRVEESIVNQILNSTDLSSRIDEMFWEHHADFQPMARVWGPAAVHRGLTMGDSIKLFSELRRRGIRAHSWV